jgi:hypothetical protein
MRPRHLRSQQRLATRAAELAFAAPQVIGHRLTRMTRAGMTPSSRDQREFQRMAMEKGGAFFEAWNAMALQAFWSSQALWLSWMRSLWTLPLGRTPSASRLGWQLYGVGLGLLNKGLAPVHRRAVGNARRLGRTRRRR